MKSWFRLTCLVGAFCACLASPALAQVATGSITGTVTDNTGAVVPGASVSLAGERLIGGVQVTVTDADGTYRFDRLPPGTYDVKFELAGFKTVQQTAIRISAAFVATVNAQLEVGQLEETVNVNAVSPTVDTRSNVQQTVMNQDILEGVPTGRDPWSLAKLVPGVQVSTYDVGGTQGMQQSALSAHGSNDGDKTFAIDGLTVNWPGGAGGSTMIYYDQGMFEEVNFQTSAIPAEVAIGGIYMNMVTKEGGNRWRGDLKYYYANDSMQLENHQTEELEKWKFPGGNPVIRQYDFNFNVGGAILKDKLWLFAGHRWWVVDKFTLGARNPDGTPAIDDNRIRNYTGKLTYQVNRNHKIIYAYNFNHKERFHRRDIPPDFVEDQASWYQNNPGYSTQVKYTGIFGRSVFESTAGVMAGVTDYQYQKGVTGIRIEDPVRNTATVAAQRHNPLPNYRLQIDNIFSRAVQSRAGDHLFKGGVQFGRLWMDDKFWVNGDMYLIFRDGVPSEVRLFNTPTHNLSYVNTIGFFFQDAWTVVPKLTLNLGVRYDMLKGVIPAQSTPAGNFIGERSIEQREPLSQRLGVWRLGMAYDVFGTGMTAIKANASRYATQVGLTPIQRVNPFQFTFGTRSWTDRNGDKLPQESELGTFSGFPGITSRYADSNGPDWPYSDEFTAGIEHQLIPDVRVGVMYYHRTNRNQVGVRNVKVPTSAYTKQTLTVPGAPTGPGGTATFYNLDPAFFGAAFQDNVYDNQDFLDTTYDGVEITASKRFSKGWQLMGGLTLGKNVGGVVSGLTVDLNDPNNALIFPTGVVGNDSKYALRLAGSYLLPYDIMFSGSMLLNQGYPYQSTYAITRSIFPTLTRSSQTVTLTERGTERLPTVFMADVRISRAIRFRGNRQIVPQLEIFNLTNAGTIVRVTTAVGSSYTRPSEILAPMIFRVGFSLNF